MVHSMKNGDKKQLTNQKDQTRILGNGYCRMNLWQKIAAIICSALLFGFGWHIRGSGTSDPSVVILLFLLLVSTIFGPRHKFNYVTFGFITIIFRLMRRGWGTFVAQAGIPGIWDGHLLSYVESYDITVPWWQGYFWLFIVGTAWSSLPSLFLGGYFFTDKKYRFKDLVIYCIIYTGGYFLGQLIACQLIPLISPGAYYDIFRAGISERNFISMRDNMGATLGIIPVFIYIAVTKKDYTLIKRSVFVMIFFGLGFSIADIWQVFGRNMPELGIPFWGLWEYTSGFIVGALLMSFYIQLMAISQKHDVVDLESQCNTEGRFEDLFGNYFIGHCWLFLYGLQESLIGLFNSSMRTLGYDYEIETWLGIIIILIVDLPFYIAAKKGKIGNRFHRLTFKQKSLILLAILLPVYFLCYAMHRILAGTLLNFGPATLATTFDVISASIVEIVCLIGITVMLIRRRLNRNK